MVQTYQGFPYFVIPCADKKTSKDCRHIIHKCGDYFQKNDDLSKDIKYNFFQSSETIKERKDARECLLYNGYKTYTDFLEHYTLAKKLMLQKLEKSEKLTENIIIQYALKYIGSELVTNYFGGKLCDCYMHLNCGGMVRGTLLTCCKTHYVCSKCRKAFTEDNVHDANSFMYIGSEQFAHIMGPREDPNYQKKKLSNCYVHITCGGLVRGITVMIKVKTDGVKLIHYVCSGCGKIFSEEIVNKNLPVLLTTMVPYPYNNVIPRVDDIPNVNMSSDEPLISTTYNIN